MEPGCCLCQSVVLAQRSPTLRALIADEPGLGKTIQAIATSSVYYREWPLLVICPSTARFHWEHEFLHWIKDRDFLPREAVVVVTSAAQQLAAAAITRTKGRRE